MFLLIGNVSIQVILMNNGFLAFYFLIFNVPFLDDNDDDTYYDDDENKSPNNSSNDIFGHFIFFYEIIHLDIKIASFIQNMKN